MPQQTIQSAVTLAETMADNKFIMGDKLVEIGVSGPNLEASLASIGMAQGELGHARLLYRWSYEVQNLRPGKLDVKEQTGKAFTQITEASNWVELIAGLYVNNVAIEVVVKELMRNKGEEISSQFDKMKNELQEHIIYAKSWCEQLANDRGSIPGRLEKAFESAKQEAHTWLEEIENDPALKDEGIISKESNLASAFHTEIEEFSEKENAPHVG